MDASRLKALYPFDSHWMDLDGLKLHYIDEGPQDPAQKDAPVLLLLHGNPTWSFYYRNLILALRGQYRVIVPDHMGCGLSDKPQAYTYTLSQHIENLSRLIEGLDLGKIAMVIHDWGGAIGMGYATRHPEKMDRFVVLNTAAFYVPHCPFRIRMCRWPGVGAFMVRGMNGFSLAALIFATVRHRRFLKGVWAGYLAPYDSWEHRIAIHRFVQDIPLEDGHPTRQVLDEMESRLSLLRDRPMLILWGQKDWCFTEEHFLPKWREHFPTAQVRVLDKAGHYVVEDAWERMVPMIEEFMGRIG